MDVAHPREDYSTHHHDTSLEVLELWMRDFSEIKKMCERHDRRTYTLDEWRSLYLNLPYLKSILDFSEFDGITDEEIQDILNKNIILYDEEVKRYYERINQQNSKLELNTTDANNSFIENGSSDNEWQTLSEIKWPDITEDEIGDHYFR